MANFNLKEAVLQKSNNKILVEMKQFEVINSEVNLYQTRKATAEEQAHGHEVVLMVNEEYFKYANSSVAGSIVKLFSASTIEKAKKDISDFCERKGKYAKIKDKENLEAIKTALKGFSGIQLEALAYACACLQESEGFVDVLYDTCMNSDGDY